MGLYDFWWNTVQEGQIAELRDEVKDHKEKVEILKQWVDHLRSELNEVKEQKNGTDSSLEK